MTDDSRLLRAAADLLRVRPLRPLLRPPASYDGTLERLVEELVVPNLPAVDAVRDFHDALVEYLRAPDPLLLVRYGGAMVRGEVHATRDGLPVKATDNSPVWFTHYMLAQGCRVAAGAMRTLLETMPAHLFEVPRLLPDDANRAGWHFAHIFEVKDRNNDFGRWGRMDVVVRFARHLHPCNVFLVPKTDWQRWGGDRRVIGWFAQLYERRYGTVWREFVRLAGVDPAALERVTGDVRIRYEERTATRAPDPRTGRAAVVGDVAACYRASRFTFKREVIEPLDDDETFRIETARDGTFEMTKAEFYRAFPRVPLTASYRELGIYHYPKLPRAALAFRVEAAD